MKKQQPKPIRSAEAVAALRAASTREPDLTVRNPDYLAHHFVGGVYKLILGRPKRMSRWLIERITPGSYGYFLARTRFVDEHLLKAIAQGVRQVVMLGAGYDSRAARFESRLAGLKLFEVDLPSTQSHKRGLMRLQGIPEPGNVVYVPHDFNTRSLITALREQGFDTNQPTAFIWEGVTYYLQESSVKDVLDSVVSQCARGSWLILDYSLRSFVNGDETTYGGPTMQRWLKKNKEPFLFGLEPGELRRYLSPCRLAVTTDLGPSEICRKYLTDRRGALVGQPLGHLRLACAVLE